MSINKFDDSGDFRRRPFRPSPGARPAGGASAGVETFGTIRRVTGDPRGSPPHGIPEYWLIDARDDEIDFQLLRRRRDRYVAVAPRGGWRHSPMFGRGIRLERRRNRMGRWTYTLRTSTAGAR